MKKLEGGAVIVYPQFYFIFYAQDELPKENDTFLDNLRIDMSFRDKINQLNDEDYELIKNSKLIELIKFINNFNKNKNNIDLKKYSFYIFLLYNFYKKENKTNISFIEKKLIKNELIKFNLNFNDEKYKLCKIDLDDDFYDKKNYYFLDGDLIQDIYNIYSVQIEEIKKYLNEFNKINNLYSYTNISIINLIENRNNIYKLNKSIPSYNDIIKKLIFSFIIRNQNDLIKLCAIETNVFNFLLKKVMFCERLKHEMIDYISKNGYDINIEKLDDILKKLNDPDNSFSKLTYNQFFQNNNSVKNKNKLFFNLNYSMFGRKYTNSSFKQTLKETETDAINIIKKLRIITKQNYDSYLVFEAASLGSKYLYSNIFKKESLNDSKMIMSGGRTTAAGKIFFSLVASPFAVAYIIIRFFLKVILLNPILLIKCHYFNKNKKNQKLILNKTTSGIKATGREYLRYLSNNN